MISDILYEAVNSIEDCLIVGGYGGRKHPLRMAIENLEDHMEAVRRIPSMNLSDVSEESTERYLKAVKLRWPGVPRQ